MSQQENRKNQDDISNSEVERCYSKSNDWRKETGEPTHIDKSEGRSQCSELGC